MNQKIEKITIPKKPQFYSPPFLTDYKAIKGYFAENGFVVIPGAINPEQIAKLRAICDKFYMDNRKLEMFSSEFLSIKELAEIPFNPTFTNVLKYILGTEIVIYPNFTMRSNLFSSWHIDKAFWNNKPYLFDESFKHIQCAIYLQDNSPKNIGGLDVVPKSHRNKLVIGGQQSFITRKIRLLASQITKPLSIKTNAGDLILFDARLIHQGSQPTTKEFKNNKYAIYWSVSCNNETQIKEYMAYLYNKVHTIKNERTVQSADRFADMRQIRFPEDYKYVIESIYKEGIKIPQFSNM